MASDYYKMVSTTNRHTDWTTEVILEVDDEGTPTKVVRAGEPVQLSAEERGKLEELGFGLEASSKSEADEVAEARASSTAGTDVAGAAPVFGSSERADQSSETDKAASSSKSTK